MGLFGAPKTEVKLPVVLDLDKLKTHSLIFKFHGKTHVIKPLSVESWFEVANGAAHLDELRRKKEISPRELKEGYWKLISAACDSMDREEFLTMNYNQIGALYKLVLDCLSGKAYTEEAEKKTLPAQAPPTGQYSLLSQLSLGLRKFVAFITGRWIMS